MNERAAAAGALIILAVALGAYIFFSQPGEADPWAGRERVGMGEFAAGLSDASEIYIVMDLRGAGISVQRNIMQCSADLAGSTALGGKDKKIYSLDTECLRIGDSEGGTPPSLPLPQCLSEINAARGAPSKALFYVRAADETLIFANELVVGMGENYRFMDCSVTSRQPAQNASSAELPAGGSAATEEPAPLEPSGPAPVPGEEIPAPPVNVS
ncbi:MAG: hypothetical protein AB1657_01000 [Candidatus Micrarchaeota archaeon]